MFSEFSLPKLVAAGDEVDFVSYSVGNHEARSFLGLMTWLIYEPRYEKTGFLHIQKRLRFRYTDGTIPLLFKPLATYCGCTACVVLDLVGNPEDRFSHYEA